MNFCCRVYYEAKKIVLKVPLWTCGVENAVCCHGYVTIKKIPGGLAEIGKDNCIGKTILILTRMFCTLNSEQ